MRKKHFKILATLLLLMAFTLGQVIIYAHKHGTSNAHSFSSDTKKVPGTDSKCPICDQNSHVQLFLELHNNVFFLTVTGSFDHRDFVPACEGIALLLSGNRGPPLG